MNEIIIFFFTKMWYIGAYLLLCALHSLGDETGSMASLSKRKKLSTLFSKFMHGDKIAFVTIVEEYSDDVYIEAYKKCNNTTLANDIVQEVFTKIYTLDTAHYPQTNAYAWLLQVTRNTAISEMRKNYHSALSFDALKPSDHIPHEKHAYHTLNSTEDFVLGHMYIDELLSALDEQSRVIVYLKAIYLFPHKMIAKLLHIPEGTVRWKYAQARKKLLDKLSN